MDVRISDHHGHRVLAIEGVVDLAATPRLHDVLRRFVAHDGPLAIGLDGVAVLDDAALGLLLGAAATARATGQRLLVVVGDGPLRQRLADTRFDRAVDVVNAFDTPIADAGGAFS